MIHLSFNGSFGDKVYILYAIIMIIVMTKSIHTFLTNGASKKLAFILKAQADKCFIPAKLTCLTKEGNVGNTYYCAEYMYVVNDKRYFVTYRITPNNIQSSTSKEEVDGNTLAFDIQKYPLLFYDEKNPAKVLCKADVFTSFEVFSQDITSKNNIYRDVDKNWVEAIDLTRY